jgi:hypothetical protein
LPVLCKEKGILCIKVPSKEELGAAAGIQVGTASVAIIQEGDSKKVIADIAKDVGAEAKAAAPKEEAPKEEPKEEKKEEAPKEEKKEEPKKEKPAKEKKEEKKPEEKKEEKPAEEPKKE